MKNEHLHNKKKLYMSDLIEYFNENTACACDVRYPISFEEWLEDLTLKDIEEITGDEN